MNNINFNVSKDTIEKLSEDVVISDSFNYVQLTFNFDSGWDKYNVKKATFFSDYEDGEEKHEADIIENTCIVPFEILKKSRFKENFFIGVYGQIIENEQLKQRNTTNMIAFRLRQGAYFANALNSGEIDPSAYDLYLAKLKEVFETKLNNYNSNAIEKTEEFDNNYLEKKEEIDALAEEVKKDKTDIEEIKLSVEASEQNAKASETNASTSEQNAQNSAENASKVLSDVTNIQEDINQTKGEIDTAKTSIDKSVENVEKLVEEATNQANISKANAELSTTNAGQVSADRTAVENAKNDISSMKTSVEQTKADAEQIKEETEQAKNETLEAKTEVENSLENERIESDKKYARAIESEEIVIDGDGQVELDEDGYMKELYAEANLPDITQENRLGYNLLKTSAKTNTQNGVDYIVNENGSVNLNGEASEIIWINLNPNFNFETDDYTAFINENTINGVSLYSDAIGFCENIKTFNISEDISKSVLIRISKGTILNDVTVYPMILKGTYTKENIPEFESYGLSPSLEFPSEFQNVVKNVEMKLLKNNLSNFTTESTGAILGTSWVGLDFEIINNYTSKISGKPTVDEYRVGGPYNSTNVLIPIDYKKNYCIYNNLNLRMGVTLVQKDGTYRQLSLDNKELLSLTENDIGISSLRISVNMKIEYKNTILRYIVCEAIEEKELILSEGQFLGKFNGYKNYIEKNKLKGQLKLLTLDGTENWIFSTTKEKTQVFRINRFNIVVEAGYLSNYFIPDVPGDEEKVVIAIDGIYFAVNKEKASTLDEWKALLKRKYEEGNPVKVLYVTAEEFEEDLSIQNKSKINSLKVYKGINNIACEDCTIKFKVNENLEMKLSEFVKNDDYATYKKAGIIKSGAYGQQTLNGFLVAQNKSYDEFEKMGSNDFIGKGTLNNVLKKERENDNHKYVKALKDSVTDINFAQIYADNSKIDNLVIKGEQLKQKVRQGYNLLHYPYVSTTKTQHGVAITDNGDGSITLNGTSTAKIDFGYQWTNDLPNDFYTFITYGLPDTCYSNYYQVGPKYGESVGNFNKTATTENINLGAQLVIPEGVTLNNITIYPMLVKGQYTRETIPAWEQYGASPSLDYPSVTEVATEQDIQTNKKNLCRGYRIIQNLDRYGRPIFIKGLKPNTTYTLALKCNASNNTYYRNEELTSTWFSFVSDGERKVFNFTTREDISKAYNSTNDDYSLLKNSIDQESPIDFEEIMLVEGTYTAETMPVFEPYEGEDYSVVLPEGDFNNAIDDFKNEIKKKDGKWCLINKFKHYVFDGVTNGLKFTSFAEKDAFNKFNINLLDRPTYIDTSKDFWKKVMAICNYFRKNGTYGSISTGTTASSIGSFGVWNSGVDFFSFAIEKERFASLEEANAKLKELYDAGKPMEIYVLASPENYEIIELPEETQNLLNSIELMEGLNNISIDKGTMSFNYNKSLARAFEEERENNANLQAQIDEIKALLSSTNTASLLAENLARDNESEVI